jgi:hypothetical protein
MNEKERGVAFAITEVIIRARRTLELADRLGDGGRVMMSNHTQVLETLDTARELMRILEDDDR